MRKAASAAISVATRARADVMMKIVVMVAVTEATISARARSADETVKVTEERTTKKVYFGFRSSQMS